MDYLSITYYLSYLFYLPSIIITTITTINIFTIYLLSPVASPVPIHNKIKIAKA